jgi:hypothetical protein
LSSYVAGAAEWKDKKIFGQTYSSFHEPGCALLPIGAGIYRSTDFHFNQGSWSHFRSGSKLNSGELQSERLFMQRCLRCSNFQLIFSVKCIKVASLIFYKLTLHIVLHYDGYP